MEETHEYANELGKQGGKNPRKIPKFSINHERFSRTIEKKSKITPTHSSDGILNAAGLAEAGHLGCSTESILEEE